MGGEYYWTELDLTEPIEIEQLCTRCGQHQLTTWTLLHINHAGDSTTTDEARCGNCDDEQRAWTLVIPAPEIKPVRKRRTGKIVRRPPWLNSNDRDHWRTLAPIKAEWRRKGHDHAAIAGLPTGLEQATIHAFIHRPNGNRADAGNFYPTAKAIVDGLVDYGLITDDNDDVLAGPYLHRGTKGAPAVTIQITEGKTLL